MSSLNNTMNLLSDYPQQQQQSPNGLMLAPQPSIQSIVQPDPFANLLEQLKREQELQNQQQPEQDNTTDQIKDAFDMYKKLSGNSGASGMPVGGSVDIGFAPSVANGFTVGSTGFAPTAATGSSIGFAPTAAEFSAGLGTTTGTAGTAGSFGATAAAAAPWIAAALALGYNEKKNHTFRSVGREWERGYGHLEDGVKSAGKEVERFFKKIF